MSIRRWHGRAWRGWTASLGRLSIQFAQGVHGVRIELVWERS